PAPLAAFFSQCSQVKLEAVPGSLGFNKNRVDLMSRHRLALALSQVEINRKNIVLLDYCLSGATLASFISLTQELMSQMNVTLNLKAVALVHDPSLANLLYPLIQENFVQLYPLDKYPTLRGFLYQESYDRLAEYQPAKGFGFERNSRIYETYCRNMGECMAYDSTIIFSSSPQREQSEAISPN
ncbi:MAG: hypothetical protein M3Q07_04255, partial [Pseudobdellovibrionaceae bacterium]|nr:hypothetical protein [Pseudobdellovibrionaceae bacterium]